MYFNILIKCMIYEKKCTVTLPNVSKLINKELTPSFLLVYQILCVKKYITYLMNTVREKTRGHFDLVQ